MNSAQVAYWTGVIACAGWLTVGLLRPGMWTRLRTKAGDLGAPASPTFLLGMLTLIALAWPVVLALDVLLPDEDDQ